MFRRGRRRRRSTVRGGMRGDGHELSILIRLGDGERQGRSQGLSMSRESPGCERADQVNQYPFALIRGSRARWFRIPGR